MTMIKQRWIAWMSLTFMLAAGLVGCSALDERQRQVIFNPTISRWGHSPGFQSVWIPFKSSLTEQSVKMHALWLGDPPELIDPKQPVILYLHGARWDVWASRARIERLRALGFAVLAIDYRGFGETSSGLRGGATPNNTLPSESMTYEDAMQAWHWLAQRFPKNKRYIYGHSLGGAIAIDLASKVKDESGIIVEGTFTSIRDVFASTNWGWLPIGPLLTQRFDSIDKVATINSPMLVVHGSNDDVIKPELGERLYRAARTPKRMILVQGGNHHDSSSVGFSQYQSALKTLFGIQPSAPSGPDAGAVLVRSAEPPGPPEPPEPLARPKNPPAPAEATLLPARDGTPRRTAATGGIQASTASSPSSSAAAGTAATRGAPKAAPMPKDAKSA